MSEKLTEWQELLAALCVAPDNGIWSDKFTGVNAYPVDQQIFEDVLVLKLPTDDPPYFLMECLCDEIANLISEIGTHEMDECLFDKKEIITAPGLYSLKLQYFMEPYTHWESGISDPTMGLSVLEVKKI